MAICSWQGWSQQADLDTTVNERLVYRLLVTVSLLPKLVQMYSRTTVRGGGLAGVKGGVFVCKHVANVQCADTPYRTQQM